MWYNNCGIGDKEMTGVMLPSVGSSEIAAVLYSWPAGKWDDPPADPAPLDTDTGANGTIKRHLFDDTTEEFVQAQIQLPFDLDPDGTVTFEAVGYAVTTVPSKNVQMKLYHSAKADGESWDAAYANKVSGDESLSATQDQLDIFTWAETVANLGWAASDSVRIMLSRIDASVGDLVGDYGLVHFCIIVPRVRVIP